MKVLHVVGGKPANTLILKDTIIKNVASKH